MLTTEVVNIIAPTEHQRAVIELARDWHKAQASVDSVSDHLPRLSESNDGQRVIIVGFPAAALPVLTRGNIPFELQR